MLLSGPLNNPQASQKERQLAMKALAIFSAAAIVAMAGCSASSGSGGSSPASGGGGGGAFLTDINPGNTVRALILFDLPKGDKAVKAELHDSPFSGGVTVRLGS